MENRNDILAELKELNSSLAGMSRIMPYHVPADYFEKQPGNLISTIKQIEEPEVRPSWGTSPFAAPAGYFDHLTDGLVAAAMAEDLSGASKEMPHRVPAGYFDRLPAQIMNAVRGANTKKTIALNSPNMFRRVQLAAAAIFIIFMGIGGYMTFFNEHTSSEKILASIPGNEIHDYLQHTYRVDVDRIEGNNNVNELQVDNKEIVQYLDETGWDVVE